RAFLLLFIAMSALPPKADMCSALGHVCFGPQADIALIDHLVGACEQCWWQCDAERLRGRAVDDKLEFGGLLDRDVTGLGPAQNLVDQLGGVPEQNRVVWPVGHETPGLDMVAGVKD